MCLAKMPTKFVSNTFRFGSGLYAEAGILGGFTCVGVRVGALKLYPAGGPYIYGCGVFSVAAELCLHPLLLLGVG